MALYTNAVIIIIMSLNFEYVLHVVLNYCQFVLETVFVILR